MRATLLFAAIAALVAAASAQAKEGVEATLVTPVPLDAAPGEELTVAWTLASVDEDGRRRPFGASGVFVQLLSASGGEATTAVAAGDGDQQGTYEATVAVPEGGIGGIAVGLHGISSGPTGTTVSDVDFPLTNDPLTATGGRATPATREDSSRPATWIAALTVASVLALGSLTVLVRRRRHTALPS